MRLLRDGERMRDERFVVDEVNHVVVACGEFSGQFEGVDQGGALQRPVFHRDFGVFHDDLLTFVVFVTDEHADGGAFGVCSSGVAHLKMRSLSAEVRVVFLSLKHLMPWISKPGSAGFSAAGLSWLKMLVVRRQRKRVARFIGGVFWGLSEGCETSYCFAQRSVTCSQFFYQTWRMAC